MIDGVFVPTQKNDAATNNKPDDTYKEDFRALLKEDDKSSANRRARETHVNSKSNQASPSQTTPISSSLDQNTNTDNADAAAALLGFNLVTPQTTTSSLSLEQPAISATIKTATVTNQTQPQQSIGAKEAAQAPPQSGNNAANSGATANATTPNETNAKLASIIKGSENSLSQAEFAQLTQNSGKQTSSLFSGSLGANNTSTSVIAQSSAQSTTAQPVAQGASSQFLQAAKSGNASSAVNGKSSSIGSNGIGTASSTAAASASNAPTASSTIVAANVNPAANSQTISPLSILPTLNTAAQDIMTALPDGDTIDGMELGSKDSSTQSTTSSTAATKTPDLPPGLRNASPVTQQAWAGLISRMDGKSHQFQIRLDPAELGRINVSIEITKDKKATVVLAARSVEALAELSKGARSLEAALADAGVELEEGGLKLEMSSDESSSFTFSDDDESETTNNDDGQKSASASQEADNDDVPRQITPEITAWSRSRVNLTA